jgi:hypothetical protein
MKAATWSLTASAIVRSGDLEVRLARRDNLVRRPPGGAGAVHTVSRTGMMQSRRRACSYPVDGRADAERR